MTKEHILKKHFGFDHFLPLQAEIIDHVLARNNALVLMPTGGGKSVCFQIPAMLRTGTAVVVSPLIALMKDQVEALRANGIEAAFLNSSLSGDESRMVLDACEEGALKLLYVSPERLAMPGVLNFLKSITISLFAIDEAHCISSWGHDFRPEYAKLHVLREQFPEIPLLALTATADKVIRRDIVNQLSIPDAQQFIASFDRPNLRLTVRPGRKRKAQVLEFLRHHRGQPGIIYCLSRKLTEEVADTLCDAGYKAGHYHAGMDADDRSKTQDAFLRDDIQVICATIAFGMGIDKSNVRWIIHYNLPKNIESYYQEIGRAGRDGAPADTLLFYSYADVIMHGRMIQESTDERRELLQAKLDRMKQYAESEICRRRILLSYFNEVPEHDCNNCDVCTNPPQKFDATIMAQKALSAIARTNEKVNLTLLVDILRGSHNRQVLANGYETIKTFGAGKDLKYDEWSDYIFQMLNSGYVDIAYDEGYALKLNDTSRRILSGDKKVMLVAFTPYEKRIEQAAAPEKRFSDDPELFDRLKRVRKAVADEQGVPAFVVFSDKTLIDMAQIRPRNREEMLLVTGIGEFKADKYGKLFLDEIQNFFGEDPVRIKKEKGDTQRMTFELYRQGKTVDQIAAERNLTSENIFSHLITLYESGQSVDLAQYVTESERKEIAATAKSLAVRNGSMKPIFDRCGGKYDYSKIRIALALEE